MASTHSTGRSRNNVPRQRNAPQTRETANSHVFPLPSAIVGSLDRPDFLLGFERFRDGRRLTEYLKAAVKTGCLRYSRAAIFDGYVFECVGTGMCPRRLARQCPLEQVRP